MLYPSGAIRPEVCLRAEITKGCWARNIYLTHPKCLKTIVQWISVRLRRGWGVSSVVEYRGLRPETRLVMTHWGQAFELAFKRREHENGPRCTRPVMHSSRQSAGSTARPVSSSAARTVDGVPWLLAFWQLQATLRRCRQS